MEPTDLVWISKWCWGNCVSVTLVRENKTRRRMRGREWQELAQTECQRGDLEGKTGGIYPGEERYWKNAC